MLCEVCRSTAMARLCHVFPTSWTWACCLRRLVSVSKHDICNHFAENVRAGTRSARIHHSWHLCDRHFHCGAALCNAHEAPRHRYPQMAIVVVLANRAPFHHLLLWRALRLAPDHTWAPYTQCVLALQPSNGAESRDLGTA